MEEATTSQLLRTRREKLEALERKDIVPFSYGFDRTHTSAEALALFEQEEESLSDGQPGSRVRIAGRMVSFRGHGKSSFAHVQDGEGRIQIYLRLNVLGPEPYEHLDLVDLGDWIGVEGTLFRTRTGEVTVQAETWEMLAKSLRPLPLAKEEVDPETGETRVHSGFQDRQSRYRQRYADLAVHDEIRDLFRVRARIVAELRAFLDERGYLEVETPVLQPIYGGAAARPFVTRHNALGTDLYLRIADELYLKRLIVGGLERVYEIGKDFRNEGIDRFHNPEFTMLEFYEAFADYEDMMEVVEALLERVATEATGSATVTFQGDEIAFKPPFRRLPFVEALEGELGAALDDLTDADLRNRAESLGIPDLKGAGRGKLLDKLFDALVQGDLVQPTFVVDYPRELSPLAKPKRGQPKLTERFELFVAGQEVANAFSELNDPLDQRARFEDQVRLAGAGDDESHPIDEDYLQAMEYGMPPTGGVGIGVDRLVMILTDQPTIREVILFPILRPE